MTDRETRAELIAIIERAIALLDELDGDADLEPEVSNPPGYADDCEMDCDFEPDTHHWIVSYHAGPTMAARNPDPSRSCMDGGEVPFE